NVEACTLQRPRDEICCRTLDSLNVAQLLLRILRTRRAVNPKAVDRRTTKPHCAPSSLAPTRQCQIFSNRATPRKRLKTRLMGVHFFALLTAIFVYAGSVISRLVPGSPGRWTQTRS